MCQHTSYHKTAMENSPTEIIGLLILYQNVHLGIRRLEERNTMRIEHIALWSPDIDRLKDFYIKYFHATANDCYENTKTGYRSYFLSFDEGSRLEIMSMNSVESAEYKALHVYGYCHIAISLSSMAEVVSLTERLRQDGYSVASEPRITGDGYFESVILDPDGNRVEIVAAPQEDIAGSVSAIEP